MTESEVASEHGRERRARRREFEPERELERLDKRHVRHAKFKMLRINITITDELLAATDARAALMNYGRGMSRSEFIGYVLGGYLQSGTAAREFRRKWREEQPAAAREGLDDGQLDR